MPNIKKNWKFFINLSGFLLSISIASFILKPVNFGIEFAGGINISVKDSGFDTKDFYNNLKNKFDLDISYSKIEHGIVNFTAKVGKNKPTNVENEKNNMERYFKDSNLEIISIESIGTSINKDMILDVLFSVLIALLFIFFYILFRFNYKFAIAAVMTLVLNIALSIAFINILNFEINLITAILTIIGYCVNDIIVIYDRIKRNINQNNNIFLIINEAVKQGKTRSILTSATTFLASISLFLIPDIKILNFATTFSFGVVFGTFASLFVSTSFLILLRTDFNSLIEKPKDPMHFAS